ncbi:MAG: TldD/PmbA family protein [Anaerolineae bacterium]|nr:TldD/PmbA family protein [Anaerolineae bacterium]
MVETDNARRTAHITHGREQALDLLADVLRLTPADEAEATLLVEDQALTRFANSAIHQNVIQYNARLAVRAVVNGGVGLALTNRLDGEGRRWAAEQAAALARLQPPDPEFPGLPAGQAVSETTSYFETTAAMTAAQRAEAVGVVVRAAAGLGFTATGAFSTTVGELAIANTAGVAVYAPFTLASLRTVIDAHPPQGLGFLTGYADAIGRDVSQIDPQAVADRAVDKCARNRDPQPLSPGSYVTVLEEIAVADLLHFLAQHGLSAQAVQEGRSFAVGKLGSRVCGDNLTLWDDATDPRGLAIPFDWEGVPTQPLTLIERGVLWGLAYDSRCAAKEGRASTGHAPSRIPDYASRWPAPTHLFVAPGHTPREALIAGVERGVLVTRFHYTHCPDPQQVIATGTTRDGTFLIEQGRVTRALRNLRFTQSVLDTLSNVEAIADRPELHRDWWSSAAHHVPAMRIRGFQFTGRTTF